MAWNKQKIRGNARPRPQFRLTIGFMYISFVNFVNIKFYCYADFFSLNLDGVPHFPLNEWRNQRTNLIKIEFKTERNFKSIKSFLTITGDQRQFLQFDVTRDTRPLLCK